MQQRNPAPMTADAAVMANYFDTMRQFLETQGQVMAAYMGEASTPMPRAAGFARPQRVPQTYVAAPVPAAMPAPAPVPVAAPAPAPVVAAPAPAIVVEHHPAPAQVAPAAPHANGNGAAPPPAPAAAPVGVELNREKLADMLLGIIEEKTGYPRDMVGLDQGLEADLGIDSIKRIEVVGAMLQALPEAMREALTPNRSKLNTQATLDGMLDILAQAVPGAAAHGNGSVHTLHADERRRA